MTLSRFSRLKEWTDRIGLTYGTEDWCMFLYAMVKMQMPVNVVELGTGLGASALWISLAMQENGVGKLYTVDDGRDWKNILEHSPELFSEEQKAMSFEAYMQDLTQSFDLASQLQFLNRSMPPLPQVDQKLDMVFSDFQHGPNDVLALLGHFLPQMNASSSIFIDSASTSFPSYALLELLVQQLNAGKVPQMLLGQVPEALREDVRRQVQNSTFTLMHMMEKKSRVQNSTAWIKIQPVDLRPYPIAPFH